MIETDQNNERDWLAGILEETVRNELVHQSIVLNLRLSIIDIQAMSKGIVAEVLSRFPVDSPDWADLRDVD